VTVNQQPHRPALRWYGGKWRLAPWVLRHFPHHDAYTEAYGGAASVLLRKPACKLETWNDLHGRAVNFFRVLRDRPMELLRLLELTPYAREEYEQAWDPHSDPLQDAHRFYLLGNQGRVGAAGGLWGQGWKYQRSWVEQHRNDPATFANIQHLEAIATRLARVQLEHDDALVVLQRYDGPGTLHFVDPPYIREARLDSERLRARYLHEMTVDDHRALAEVLHRLEGMVVLSGYPHPLYDTELYPQWKRVCTVATTDAGDAATECLWLSPTAAAAQPQQRLWDG
jgi:DNA adenine methylase